MQKIVIIDDNSIIRLVLSSMFLHTFKDFEFETFTADNGVAGLGYVFITRPDLIIVDITLPKYSGKEVIDFLSSNGSIVDKSIPIIVLTENESCPILPGNFKCINKSSKQFEELLQESVSKILPVQSKNGMRSKLFRILTNKIINNGNKVDVINRSFFQNKLKALLSIPYLIFLNLKFSLLITLFFIFFERHEKESNIELRRKDGASLRINTIPAITVFFTLIFFSIFQISSVLGGVGIFTFLRGNENVAAASYTWDGGGDDITCGGGVGDGNKWSCALNWSSDIVPTSTDTVTFNGTSTKDAVVDSSFAGTITTLNISAGYTGTITLQRSLDLTSNFTQASGTFTGTGQNMSMPFQFTLSGGTFNAPALMTLGQGITISGSSTFNANSGTINFTGGTTGNISCNNSIFNLVQFNGLTGVSKTIDNTCNIPLGNNPTVTNAITLSGTLSGTGTINMSSNGNILNAGSTFSGFTAMITNGVTISGATLDFSSFTSYLNNNSLVVSSGSLILPNNATITNGTTLSNGALTLTSNADLNGALTISGGTFTAPSGTMTIAGALNITGAPTFNANGGTITFDGAIGATMSCNNVAFNLVTFNNSASKSFPAGCNIPLGNNPILLGSATVSIDGGTFSGTGKFTKSASTFGMSTATAQLTGFTEFQANAVSISNNAVLDLSTYTSALFTSTLFLTSGTVTVPNGADFNLGITQSGGTFNAPAGNMTLDGNLLISGSAVFNANGGTITFDGTQFSSANCNSTSIFNNVIVAATSTTIKTFSACPAVPLGNNPTTTRTAFVNSTVSGTGTWTMAGGGDTAFTSGSVISGFTGISAQGFTVNGANLNLSGLTSFVQGPAGNTVSLISGSLQLPNGSDINGSLTISGGTFTAPSGTLNIAQNLTISGASVFNANGGTVNLDGATGGTASCNNATFNLVTFTHTLNTKFVSSNCNLPLGNNPVLGTANGSTGVVNNGILTGTGTLNTGVFTFNTGSSLVGFTDMNLGSTFTVAGGTADFSSYTSFFATSAAGGAPVVLTSGTLTLPDGSDLNSSLTISGGTFNAPSGTMNLAGNLTVSGSPTFNANGGIFNFDGTTQGILNCNGITFNLVTFTHPATTLKIINNNCTLPLGANPTITGSIRLNSSTATLSGTGTLTNTAEVASSFDLVAGQISGFSGLVVYGSILVNGMDLDLSTYSPVTVYGRNTDNAIRLSGGSLTAPTGAMVLYDRFRRSGGTFSHNNGTVEFTSEAADTTVGPHDYSFTFYNLTVNVTIPTDFISSDGETTTVLNNLTLLGADDSNRLSLVSGVPGSQWFLDASSVVNLNLNYLNVIDSNSLNRVINVAGLNVTNGGNNTNWNFGNPVVANLGPTNLVDDSAANNQKPTFTFDITDPDSSEQVTYQIQIDNDDDFSSPVIDSTSTPAAQGSFTFTPTSNISEGKYYWRVRGFDASGGISEYVAANDGSTAFTIDITPPTGGVLLKSISEENPLNISLLLLAFDNLSGVGEMIISENLNFAGAVYEPYQTSKNFTLSSSDIKVVYARYKDNAGNESAIYLANIVTSTPITTPTPIVTVTITPTPSVTPTPSDVPTSNEEKNIRQIISPEILVPIPILTFLFITSISAAALATSSNFALTLENLLKLFGVFTGAIIPRNKKYWGVVFDANESKGMAFTIVRLINLDTKEMTETVSDVNGCYGFAASKGKYRIEVIVEGYEKYQKEVEINQENDIVEDIKLTRIGTSQSLRMKLNFKANTIINIVKIILMILITFGFTYSLFIYFENPILTNLMILILYVVILIINIYLFIKINGGSIGKVVDKETKLGLNWTSVRLFAKDRTYISLTNAQGLFRLNVPKGEYRKYIYREGYKHDAVDTVKSSNAGFINTNFELEKKNNENNDEGFGSI